MLPNYVAGNGVVLIVDNDGHYERQAKQLIITSLLLPSSTNNSPIHVLPAAPNLDTFNASSLDQNVDHLLSASNTSSGAIVLIHVAEYIQTASLRSLFQLVHRMRLSQQVRQLFLWLSRRCLLHGDSDEPTSAVVAYLEHMSTAALTLLDATRMQLVVKKAGGIVQRKHFTYTVPAVGDRFDVTEVHKSTIFAPAAAADDAVNPESLTTFKINFDEEEMEARTALKLPYERTSDKPTEEEVGGRIIYSPDADDDFDEEDPDDDLNI